MTSYSGSDLRAALARSQLRGHGCCHVYELWSWQLWPCHRRNRVYSMCFWFVFYSHRVYFFQYMRELFYML